MKYLSINAFAKMCGVTKHTLYHYEDVGLFKPVYVSEKGYRYYSYRQYDQMRFILTLRELDIPIEGIKAYMAMSDEGIADFFSENIQKIEMKIRKMQQMKKYMEKLIRQSENMKTMRTGEVFIEELPEMKIFRSQLLKKASDYEQGLKEYAGFLCEHKVEADRVIGECMRLDRIREKKYFEYAYVFIESEDTAQYNDQISGGRYLSLYYSGSYEDCYKGYELLIETAKQRNMKLDEYGYEIYVTNNILVQAENAQITKIFARILEE